MANLIIHENGSVRTRPAVNGEEITVKTPCSCSDVTGVQINGVAYPFYDALGDNLSDASDLFAAGSIIRVMIDTDNTRAYILNRGISKPNYVTETMLASGWVDNTYSFEETYPHTSYNISIEVAPTATSEQFEAFGGAMICGSHDSNVATALGDVPTEDIPIIIKVVRK